MSHAEIRQSLVHGDESARHPFLRQLPRHIRHGEESEPLGWRYRRARRQNNEQLPTLPEAERRWRPTIQDVKDFLLAYCACFVAFSVFFA